jgi:2,3-bisphosphoglycerate-dependent phosphoglycerate mutase
MTTIYFIRHAQSHQSVRVPFADWPLSAAGRAQAARLADLLQPLGLSRLYSSPFVRCVQTIGPFVEKSGLDLAHHLDLRERHFAPTEPEGIADIWHRSWTDFDFALPDYECSRAAQQRFVTAVREIATGHAGETIGICTHGNVIGLFLHHLDPGHGRETTEAIRNPDVFRFRYRDEAFAWDQHYRLGGLDEIASDHAATPFERE